MRLGNLIRSEPFRATIRVLAAFLVLYSIAAFALVRSVETTLRDDLAALTKIESELLSNIYREQGQDGLVAAINALSRDGQLPDRTYGLFSGGNLRLSGPLSVRPDFIGVDTKELSVLSGGRVAGRYVLWVDKLDALTLVTGRNGTSVERAVTSLSMGLTAFGALLAVITIPLGLYAGHRSQRRLDAMERALRSVSQGNLDTRLPIGRKNDQFDRVSLRMNENLNRLERLVTSVKSTASAIAHDLKTPLSHAQIAMHDAADAVRKGDDALEKIAEALDETDKLNAIFETVLRLSRIKASRDRSHFAPTSLREIAVAAVEFLSPLAEENTQALTIKPGEGVVQADCGMILQAVINLVQNACVHAGPEAQITITIEDNSIRVTDTGAGIDHEALKTVTEPFARAASDRSTPGHGLGLALVQAIAEVHDATLSLVNTSTGFEASLTFPKFKNS